MLYSGIFSSPILCCVNTPKYNIFISKLVTLPCVRCSATAEPTQSTVRAFKLQKTFAPNKLPSFRMSDFGTHGQQDFVKL